MTDFSPCLIISTKCSAMITIGLLTTYLWVSASIQNNPVGRRKKTAMAKLCVF